MKSIGFLSSSIILGMASLMLLQSGFCAQSYKEEAPKIIETYCVNMEKVDNEYSEFISKKQDEIESIIKDLKSITFPAEYPEKGKEQELDAVRENLSPLQDEIESIIKGLENTTFPAEYPEEEKEQELDAFRKNLLTLIWRLDGLQKELAEKCPFFLTSANKSLFLEPETLMEKAKGGVNWLYNRNLRENVQALLPNVWKFEISFQQSWKECVINYLVQAEKLLPLDFWIRILAKRIGDVLPELEKVIEKEESITNKKTEQEWANIVNATLRENTVDTLRDCAIGRRNQEQKENMLSFDNTYCASCRFGHVYIDAMWLSSIGVFKETVLEYIWPNLLAKFEPTFDKIFNIAGRLIEEDDELKEIFMNNLQKDENEWKPLKKKHFASLFQNVF